MPLPNQFDIIAFVLNALGIVTAVWTLVLTFKKNARKKNMKNICVLIILATIMFLSARAVIRAKPDNRSVCPEGGVCNYM